jgi:hypothetical protein
MAIWPIFVVHIGGGIVGILSVTVAMVFRKGSRGHIVAGRVFVIAMLCMAAGGTCLAIIKSQTGNVIGGVMAFYMVATALATAKRRDGETSIFDWGALLVPLAVGVSMMIGGFEAARSQGASNDGVPIGMYFFLGSVALLSAAGDVRMLVGGGVFGAQRIVRHLWRMCFGLFIATGSFFLGQQRVFPAAWRGLAIWFVPALLPLVLMIYWLLLVWFTKAYKKTGSPYRTQTIPVEFGKQTLPG